MEHPLPALENPHLGYPSRLSFGFPPFSMEIKRWFVFGSHPLCPGCSHFSKVQRDSSRPFALCTRRCVEDASFMSDHMSKRSTKVLHETQDSPIRWDRSVRVIKVGNGRFYTQSSIQNSFFMFEDDTLPPVLRSPGWFMVSLDLSKHYLHFCLTEASTHWMGFQLEGKPYVFLPMMFGFGFSA